MHKILLVNSNKEVLNDLISFFKPKDYEIVTASSADSGLKKAKEYFPDIIITDLVLSDSDGIYLCKQIRETKTLSKSLVIFYSTQSENFSQIAAFKAGADDFIVPPISPVIFNLKLQAMIQRTSTNNKQSVFRVNGIIVDKGKHQVKIADREIVLAKKEFEILELLVSDPQKVFTREEMKERIWGVGVFVRNRTIDVHIRKLRENIGDRLIVTVKGVGYKFNVN